MSGYLYKLATRALGQHTAAKPLVTPLFGEAALGPIDSGATAALDHSAAPDDFEPRSNFLAPAPARPAALAQAPPARADATAVKPADPSGERVPVALSVATTRHAEAMAEAEAERAAEVPRHMTAPTLPIDAPLAGAAPQRHDLRAAVIQPESPLRYEAIAVTAQISTDRSNQRPAPSAPDDIHVSRAAIAPASATPSLRAERTLSIEETVPARPTAAAHVSIPQDVEAPRSGVAVIALQPPRATRAAEPISSITDRRSASPIPPVAQAPSRPVVEPTTVNVTIGRVEVRATTAPAAPAPRQRAAPGPTNLELYLQRRSNGARA